MSTSVQILKARKLRTDGKSIRKIAQKLSISVGTAHNWTSDIKLTKEQINTLNSPNYSGRRAYFKSLKQKTILKIESLEKIGIKEVGKLSNRDLFIAGVALYWAEGFKKDSQAGLASLDPKMIQFFIKWLNVCFGYKDIDLMFRITANISHKDRIKTIERYWSELLNIPLNQFQKAFFQDVKWKKTYENPEQYFGVLRVKVRKSKDFLRRISGFMEGLKLQSQI